MITADLLIPLLSRLLRGCVSAKIHHIYKRPPPLFFPPPPQSPSPQSQNHNHHHVSHKNFFNFQTPRLNHSFIRHARIHAYTHVSCRRWPILFKSYTRARVPRCWSGVGRQEARLYYCARREWNRRRRRELEGSRERKETIGAVLSARGAREYWVPESGWSPPSFEGPHSRGGEGRKLSALPFSLSLPLLEIDARAYLERVLGVVSRASAAEGWGEGERESEREEGGVNRRTETRLAEWHSGPRTRRLVLRDDESRRLRADCSTDPLCVRGDRIRVFA